MQLTRRFLQYFTFFRCAIGVANVWTNRTQSYSCIFHSLMQFLRSVLTSLKQYLCSNIKYQLKQKYETCGDSSSINFCAVGQESQSFTLSSFIYFTYVNYHSPLGLTRPIRVANAPVERHQCINRLFYDIDICYNQEFPRNIIDNHTS